jgi:hypothetical protein
MLEGPPAILYNERAVNVLEVNRILRIEKDFLWDGVQRPNVVEDRQQYCITSVQLTFSM